MADFRGETIYFIVVDRFCDGDPSNNCGKQRDHDPTRTDWYKWWGGDLRGVIGKLDYLASIGVSAIWLTPVFDQMEGVAAIGGLHMAPYHGYWARDFKRIDEHLVERPEDVRVFARDDTVFDELVSEMHRRGMKLVLDIVCNHSSPAGAGGHGELLDDGAPITSFDADAGSWYRRTGGVTDWSDLDDVQTHDLAGLADFDEENHAFRRYIKDAMRGWLDKGVDAFRVDTVKHMPLWFWQEFTGDMRVHRPDLFAFGEWFQGGCWDEDSVRFARSSGMTMLDFAWRNAVVNALAYGSDRGLDEVAAVVDRDALYRDPSELVTFVDNHDLPRFLSISNDPDRFRLALLLTMVARGIPCIAYGNEQLLHADTDGGNDPYNRPWMDRFDDTPLGRDIATLAALRKRNPALQRGGMRQRWIDADHYAFTRCWLGSTVLVAVNRDDAPAALDLFHVELPDGIWQDVLGGPPIDVVAGETRVVVPPRGIVVYEARAPLPTGKVVVDVQVHGITTRFGEVVHLCGDAPELGAWDLSRAIPLEYVNERTWAGTVAFDQSLGRRVHYKFVVRRGQAWTREPGRGHHRHVPERAVIGVGGQEGEVTAIWRDDWRTS